MRAHAYACTHAPTHTRAILYPRLPALARASKQTGTNIVLKYYAPAAKNSTFGLFTSGLQARILLFVSGKQAQRRCKWPQGFGKVPKLYNGSHRRTLAQGTRNSVCTTFASPRIKALLAAMPPKPATLSGKGSVAHTTGVPAAISVHDCRKHGKAIAGDSDPKISEGVYPTTINGETVWIHKGWHTAVLGTDMLYCTKCYAYVLAPDTYLWYPRPTEPKPWHKAYLGVNGINGNAMIGERV